MAQVLQNLLDNALKYGRDGGVLTLGGHAGAARNALAQPAWIVVVAVGDQGAGIPREHLPRLTERFYRVDKGRSRAVGGTGLGLAIVKHIVNRHRGQLLIESEEGKGTTVSVWLPVSAPAPRPEPPTEGLSENTRCDLHGRTRPKPLFERRQLYQRADALIADAALNQPVAVAVASDAIGRSYRFAAQSAMEHSVGSLATEK